MLPPCHFKDCLHRDLEVTSNIGCRVTKTQRTPMLSPSSRKHGDKLQQQLSSPLATTPLSPSSSTRLYNSKRPSKVSTCRRNNREKKSSSDIAIAPRKSCSPTNSLPVRSSSASIPPSSTPVPPATETLDHEENVIAFESETEADPASKTKSKWAQTNEEVPLEKDKIPIPLSAITLQSILIAARAKSASKMSPKQYAAFQLSNDIIVMIQQSLQSERDAFGFVGQPIISVVGEQIDRMAWWFWVVQQAVQELNPPRGYILPALKMLRQEISSLADIAVEIISVQKTIQKQLHRMASILNTVFSRHEDLFGVREWDQKLQELRAEDTAEVQEKFDKWVQQSDEGTVRLTVFENKAMLVQHESNEEYKPMTLNKLSLASQKEFIKSCLDHMSSVLRWSCDHSVQSHEELLKAEKEIQESIDKLVKKLDQLRRVHRLRDSSCAYLLKKSLHTLGLCFYEFIDMVRFIRKLGRFVLLASEHVLRHANRWSHLCDATCLAQLDLVLGEFSTKSGATRNLFQCFGNRFNSHAKKNRIMSTFEEYFQRWINANLSTVQVTIPLSNQSAYVIFSDDGDATPERAALRRRTRLKADTRRTKQSVPDVLSTKELEIEVIHSVSRVRKKAAVQTGERIQKKLEEIGIKLNTDQVNSHPLSSQLLQYEEQAHVSCKKSSKSVMPVEKTKTSEPT